MAQEEFPSKANNKINFKALAGKERNMKKYRRLISLALAVVMVFTFMAMSASAAMTEIQPRFACSYCGGVGLRTVITRISINSEPFTETARCNGVAFAHAHYHAPSIQDNYCASCGKFDSSVNYNAVYCPYKGYLS